MNIADSFYTYKARIHSIYDGDTIRADLDLGMGIWKHESLRLYGINTPEIRGEEREEGLEAKAFVQSVLEDPHMECVIKTHKDKKGKYGRLLAEVFYGSIEHGMMNLNQQLIELGYAEPYEA